MRIPQWSAFVLGLVLTWHASHLRAQGPAGPLAPVYAGPADGGPAAYDEAMRQPPGADPSSVYPPPYEVAPEAYGPGGYGAATYPSQPIPPDFEPYPNVSPYEHSFDQLRREQGMWFRETNNATRQWSAGLELLDYKFRKPDARQIGQQLSYGDVHTGQIRDLGEINQDIDTLGLRAFANYFNPDDSGGEIVGFWLQEQAFRPGLPNGHWPALIERVDLTTGQLSNNPLSFDSYYQVVYNEAAWGTEGNLITTPIIGRGMNKLRGIYGVRYLQVREGLNVDAADSVLGRTRIDSIVNTNAVGPQAGLRWDLGGNKFKIIFLGKVGALVNMQRQTLEADNYFGQQALYHESHTHISPMVEGAVFGQFPLFGYLPVFNKMPLLKDSLFNIGYDYTILYLTQRPGDQVIYGDPTPALTTHRTRWDIHGIRLGLQWKF